MKITQIEIYKSPIKLKEPFIISLGLLAYAENIIVVIRTDEGITGFGESSPFRTINGESMETCFSVAQDLAKVLIGKNPTDIETCTQLMDTVIWGNSSIKSAFDIAMYDIASTAAGLPLYTFLGGTKNKTIITDYTVSFGAPEKMASGALKIKENGFQIIKVKLGGTKETDIQRIRQIRQAIGPEIPLRLDANQGWNPQTCLEILNELASLNIQFCEEPIPRWNFMELPALSQKSPIPIMADESCGDHHDAQRLIDLNACKHINIKLGKSSGLFKALKIVDLAEKYSIKIQLGAFLESRLGMTASAHLAFKSPNIKYFDFDTPLMQSEDHVLGGITYQENGIITVPDTPGLGAKVDERYLGKLEKVVIK